MVNPVMSGVSQQIPAATTFQPGGNDAVKRQEQDDRLNATKTGDVETTRTQNLESHNSEKSAAPVTDRTGDTTRVSASSARGTTLDISV
jgi:hypothetical protein